MSNFTISNSTMSSNSACRLFNNMICVLRSGNTISFNIKVSSISSLTFMSQRSLGVVLVQLQKRHRHRSHRANINFHLQLMTNFPM